MLRFSRAAAAAFLLLLISASIARAGTTGAVRGTVLADGAPRAGVSVELRAPGRLFRTETDAAGRFSFPDVPFGHYLLIARLAGYAEEQRPVEVASGTVLQFTLILARSGAPKTIVVTSANANAQVSGVPVAHDVITREQIRRMPNDTSLDRMLETVPGIVRFSYNEPVAHGFHGVTYEIDGAPMPLATTSNFSEIIDPADVDAIEVFTGAIPAEYGGSRMGALINITTDRAFHLERPFSGTLTTGIGNQGQGFTSMDSAAKIGAGALFLNVNVRRTGRGLDAPTFVSQHDAASQGDQFLRWNMPVGERGSLAFDASNQLAQFQIPINTDPNNIDDPEVQVPGTDDVQIEYDRFFNVNYTLRSKGDNAVFKLVPWVRYSRTAYDGDLAKDVLAVIGPPPVQNMVGLREDRRVSYVGLTTTDMIESDHHAVKFGLDLSRAVLHATQELAQLGAPDLFTAQDHAGAQIGAFVQDDWTPSRVVSLQYGLRYDHSTGYVGGFQYSPRIGLNIAADRKDILHFYYGRFYAAPELEDVRQDCVVLQGCPTLPVYDLKPEHDSYYEMGVLHSFSPLVRGSADIWGRTVANVLDTTQLLNTPIFAVFNNTVGQAEGIDLRLDGRTADESRSWSISGGLEQSLAGGISGSTFLFGPGPQPTYPLQPEDHEQLATLTASFTRAWGPDHTSFATLQGNFGTGYPVNFEGIGGNGFTVLPSHLTFDLAIGRQAGITGGVPHLGYELQVDNLLNHQSIIKIANGFNTTQIADGRRVLFQLSAPL